MRTTPPTTPPTMAPTGVDFEELVDARPAVASGSDVRVVTTAQEVSVPTTVDDKTHTEVKGTTEVSGSNVGVIVGVWATEGAALTDTVGDRGKPRAAHVVK